MEVRSDDRLLFTLGEVVGLVELTAGCFATVGAEELRVPIELPIRERGLVVGCLFAFEAGGVLRLLEPPIREALLERAAGCFAPLGTDGLVVLIVLPIREVMLGLIRLLEFVLSEVEALLRVLVAGLFVIVVLELLLGWLLLPLSEVEGLLDGVLVLIELPIRDVMLGLIRLLVLGAVDRELIDRLEMLLLGALLVMVLLEMLLLGALLVMALLEMLLLGALLVMVLLDVLLLGVRLVMDLLELLLGARLVMVLLDVLLLGVRLVMVLLDVLLLGVRLDMDLLDVLLLGVRLVMDLLDVLLLGVRLVIARLELRLDETLLERLDDDLDGALGAGAGLEACLLELLDLLLLDRVLAAKTGSQNNKRANKMQETRKSEPTLMDSSILIFDL